MPEKENMKQLVYAFILAKGHSAEEFDMLTDEIERPPPQLSEEVFLNVISIWNRQVKIWPEMPDKNKPDEDLSWDSPGHLPPDPPAEIRKILQDRENKMDKTIGDK